MDEPKRSGSRVSKGKDYTKRKLFVGNLNLETTEAELKEYMSQFGTVTEVTIIKDKHSKKSRGFGFVTMESKKVTRQLLTTQLNLADHPLELNLAEPKTPSKLAELKDVSEVSKIFIGGIPKTSTNQDLLDCFSKYGEIVEATVAEDKKTFQHRGFGFVVFATAESAQAAMKDYKLHMIQSKWVECKIALPKFVHETTKKGPDEIAEMQSSSTESESDKFPDFFGKLEKHESVEVGLTLSHKLSSASTGQGLRSQGIQLGSMGIKGVKSTVFDSQNVTKSGHLEAVITKDKANRILKGVDQSKGSQERDNTKIGTTGMTQRSEKQPRNQTVHRSVSKKPIDSRLNTLRIKKEMDHNLQKRSQSPPKHQPVAIDHRNPHPYSKYPQQIEHPTLKDTTSYSSRVPQKKAPKEAKHPEDGLIHQKVKGDTQPTKKTPGRTNPKTGEHTGPESSMSRVERNPNYRYNTQKVTATHYWSLFRDRKLKVGTVSMQPPAPVTSLPKPARVNKADEQPRGREDTILPKHVKERSQSRFYTPFGGREKSQIPAVRGVSTKPALMHALTSSLQTMPSRVLQKSEPTDSKVADLKEQRVEEGPTGVESLIVRKSSPEPDFAFERDTSLVLHPQPTLLDDKSLKEAVAAEKNLPEAQSASGKLLPLGLSSPNDLLLRPLAIKHAEDLKGRILDSPKQAVALQPSQEHVESSDLHTIQGRTLFDTPRELAEGFSLEDQFMSLRELSNSSSSVVLGQQGGSMVKFQSGQVGSGNQIPFQVQADLKIQQLRYNLASNHIEELERTKLTLAKVIARKSRPTQRTSKDPSAKGAPQDRN